MIFITIEKINSFTAHEIIDFVAKCAELQGAKCTNGLDGECGDTFRYRNGNLACFIGFMMPDYFYKEEFEGESVDSLYKKGVIPETEHLFLLKQLQIIHDFSEVEDWSKKLKELKKVF